MRKHRPEFAIPYALLVCTLISGCASFQSTLAQLETTGAISSVGAPAASTGHAAEPAASSRANAGQANTRHNAPETTSRIATASVPVTLPKTSACDRSKAISVGMTMAEVYASCWGKPKSVNSSMLGSTKTEMLFYEGYNYVYLENGIVKSIEMSGRQ